MPSFFTPLRTKVSKASLGSISFSEDIFSRFELTQDISSSWVELRQKKLNERQIVKFLCEKISQMHAPFQEKCLLRTNLFDRWWRALPLKKALDEKVQTVLETIESLRISAEDKVFFNERVLLKWWLTLKFKMSSSNHVITYLINQLNLFSLGENEKHSLKLYLLNQWLAEDSRLKSKRIFMIALMNFSFKDKILLQMEFIKEWWEDLIPGELPSKYILQELEDINKMSFKDQETFIHTQGIINLIKSVNDNNFLIEAILVYLLKEIIQAPKSLETQVRMQVILLRQYGMQLKPQIYLEKILNLLKFVPLSEEQRKVLKFNLFSDAWRKFFKEQELSLNVENALKILNKVVLDKEDEDLFQKALLNYWLESSGLKFASVNILKLSLCDQELAMKLLMHLWQHLRRLNLSPYKILSDISSSWPHETSDSEILLTSLFRQWWPQFDFSNLDTYLFFVGKMQAIESVEVIEEYEQIEEIEKMDLFFIEKMELIEKTKSKILEKNLLIREKKESQFIDLLEKWAEKLKESGFSKLIVFKEIMIEVSRGSFLEQSKRDLQSQLINQLWDAVESDEDAEKPLQLFLSQLFKVIDGVSLPLKEKDFLMAQLQIRYDKELASCVRRLSFSDESMDELEELQIRDILPEEAVSASEVNEFQLDIKKAPPAEAAFIAGEVKESDFYITQVELVKDTHPVQHKKEMFKPFMNLRKPMDEMLSRLHRNETALPSTVKEGGSSAIPFAFFAHLEEVWQDSEVEPILVEYEKELESYQKDPREFISDIEEVETIYAFPSTEEEVKEDPFSMAQEDTICTVTLMR